MTKMQQQRFRPELAIFRDKLECSPPHQYREICHKLEIKIFLCCPLITWNQAESYPSVPVQIESKSDSSYRFHLGSVLIFVMLEISHIVISIVLIEVELSGNIIIIKFCRRIRSRNGIITIRRIIVTEFHLIDHDLPKPTNCKR